MTNDVRASTIRHQCLTLDVRIVIQNGNMWLSRFKIIVMQLGEIVANGALHGVLLRVNLLHALVGW